MALVKIKMFLNDGQVAPVTLNTQMIRFVFTDSATGKAEILTDMGKKPIKLDMTEDELIEVVNAAEQSKVIINEPTININAADLSSDGKPKDIPFQPG